MFPTLITSLKEFIGASCLLFGLTAFQVNTPFDEVLLVKSKGLIIVVFRDD